MPAAEWVWGMVQRAVYITWYLILMCRKRATDGTYDNDKSFLNAFDIWKIFVS